MYSSKYHGIFKRKVGQLNLQEIEPEPEPVVPEPVKEEIPVPVKGTAKTHIVGLGKNGSSGKKRFVSMNSVRMSPLQEKRKGTFDYPVLHSIHTTQPCTGRVRGFF